MTIKWFNECVLLTFMTSNLPTAFNNFTSFNSYIQLLGVAIAQISLESKLLLIKFYLVHLSPMCAHVIQHILPANSLIIIIGHEQWIKSAADLSACFLEILSV